MKKFDLEERLLDYATDVVRLTDKLNPGYAAKHIGTQLLRAGTSPLFNHGEAQGAESQKDFIHRMGICLKELKETRRALMLVKQVPLTTHDEMVLRLLSETEELIRIFFTSIRTAKSNLVKDERAEYSVDPLRVESLKFQVES